MLMVVNDAPVAGGSERLTGSFEEFFEAEYARLARALFLLTGDRSEAEDLAQESMVRILESWDRASRADSPTGYLYRTALNLHRSRLRRLGVRTRKAIRGKPSADQIGAVDDRDELGRLLASLPAGQREALILVEWMGLTAEEASVVLGIQPVSTRVRVSRAKAFLRERNGSSEGDDG